MTDKLPPGATPMKIYRCKHCRVRVISKTDSRAVLGKVHSKFCPRSKKQ